MSKKYPGGLITKTPVTPAGPYQDGAASGIWTMEQVEYWRTQNLWPIAGNVDQGDPYFKYVTMLLPGNGTNGAKNKTYLDSSSNNFTLTDTDIYSSNGQGSFSPYGSLWSNYFNASSTNYIKFAANSAFQLTGDFTIEGWFNPDGTLTSGSGTLVGDYYYGSSESTGQFQVCWNANNKIINSYFVSGSGAIENLAVGTAQISTWNHFALVRSGSTVRLYLNGQGGSTTSTSATFGSNVGMWVGIDGNGINEHFGGNISNIRIVKGTAIYDVTSSTLTVPTTPLTAVSGTSLLTCQSNRFKDNSSNNFAVTITGTPSVTRFTPFEPVSPGYTTAVFGGSGHFDGGSGLTLSSGGTPLSLTGDFTIEFWLYRQAGGSYQQFICAGSNVQTFKFSTTSGWYFYAGSAYFFTANLDQTPLNAWTHIAFARSGSTITMYANGVSVGTASYSSTISYNSTLNIGCGDSSSEFISGKLTDVRIVKGTAVYTSNFTPPTAPLTAISGTQLLCSFTNAGIVDYAANNDIFTWENVQISTTQSKFGGSSIYFNRGAGGGNLICNNTAYTTGFGTGDFTIEMWIYKTSTGVTQYIFDGRSGASVSPFIYINTSEQLLYAIPSGTAITGGTISANTWTFITVCRSSGVTKMYINGTQTGSSYTDTNNYVGAVGRPAIGATVSYSDYFGGYMDDVRITKGYARYTGNFTAPTTAFNTY